MNAIEIKGLCHAYGRVEAVHDLHLEVPSGSICALVGPNGAGKTTTLRALAGMLRPRVGSVRVLGVEAHAFSPVERRRIAYLEEGVQQPAWMTVREHLDFCRPLYPSWDRTLERTLLERFELPEGRRLGGLSRGMRMKALLVGVLSFRPEVLLFDEPFSGFDPEVRDEVARGLGETARAGRCTVLMTSHDIEEVERVADRMVMLMNGRKVLDEAVSSLLAGATTPVAASSGALREVYLTTARAARGGKGSQA